MRPVGDDLDFQGTARALNLPNPGSDQEPATKAYVDGAVGNIGWKDNVRVAAQVNVNTAAPGAAINAVTLSNNDRVLLPAQTTATQNGIYIFNGASTPMTRAADADTWDELENAVVVVDEGTSAGAVFRQTQVNGTLGTDDIVWATFFPAAPASSESVAGVIRQATQSEADAGTAGLALTPERAKAASWMLRKVSATIGDGSATSFNIDHNFGTRDVQVAVYRNSGSYDDWIVGITRPSANRVTITFSTAPASNALRVVIIG